MSIALDLDSSFDACKGRADAPDQRSPKARGRAGPKRIAERADWIGMQHLMVKRSVIKPPVTESMVGILYKLDIIASHELRIMHALIRASPGRG